MVKMECDTDIKAMPLSALPFTTVELLSRLLDTPKLLPTEGPDKLPRDWRGLASLLNISTEIAASIKEHTDKTLKVLELWMLRRDGTANVGQLLTYLQRLDRFDVHDDICESLREFSPKNVLNAKTQNQIAISNNNRIPTSREFDLITYEDRPGHIQKYDAFVLYAKEDKEFVDELMRRMHTEGFKLCTKDDLLPGYATKYAPIAQLILERCQRIILVYSPEFLQSSDDVYYMDYAQAVSIGSPTQKLLPIMYRWCQLPSHLAHYHNLNYEGAMYDFWHKLKQSLQTVRRPQLNGTSTTQSSLNIVEMSNEYYDDNCLFLPTSNTRSNSMNDLESIPVTISRDDCKSLSSVSQISQKSDKKPGKLRKFINTLKGKKQKKVIAVEN